MTGAGGCRAEIAAYIALRTDDRPTLAEIGRAVGVTRERVRQLLPDYYACRDRREDRRNRLAQFIIAHPEAQLTQARGGMTMAAIAKATRITRHDLPVFWRELGLVNRRILTLDGAEISQRAYERDPVGHAAAVERWRLAHPDHYRLMRRAAARRREAARRTHVLRTETCLCCGVHFDWTATNERYKLAVTCSRRCTVALGTSVRRRPT